MASVLTSQLQRRDWLQTSLAGALSISLSSWLPRLAQSALGNPKKHCILLWMDGGPSHLDTFDPKPDAASEVSGPFEAIDTSVPGIQVTERFPMLAQQAKHMAMLRGMCTDEADHGRARIYMHTGYKPGQGGLTYPGLGSIVSNELGDADFALPNFITTGTPLNKYDFLTDPGYLGPQHGGLVHYDPNRSLDNLQPVARPDEFQRRVEAVAAADSEFLARYRVPAAEARRSVFDRAVRLMNADAAQAFDLSRESDSVREAYGSHSFQRGCLLARRLVEAGVPFIEVYSSNWDTHEKKSTDEAAALMPVVDRGMATLISDLSDRGLLDNTLVVWMGEFGRTPRMNRNGGRDHYAKAWTTVLAGGGIRGGQVVGRTDSMGSAVVDRPIPAIDFMATICRALGIDFTRQFNTPIGRPIQIVEKGATPIRQLLD